MAPSFHVLDTLADNIGIVSGYFFPASSLWITLDKARVVVFGVILWPEKLFIVVRVPPIAITLIALDSPEPDRQVTIVASTCC